MSSQPYTVSPPTHPQPPQGQSRRGGTLRLGGVIPPVVTPFTDSGAVDLDALATLVDHLIADGVRGVFTLGSSGETAYLTDEQRERVADTVVRAAAGRVPVLVGCIDTTAARVIDHARRADRLGADGIVATGPFYALNDAAEIADHFRAIRAAVDLPLLAYDIPSRVQVKLDPAMLVMLGTEGAIVGVKDSSGDDISFRRLVLANRAAGSPLALLTGHEIACDAMALMGADGLVPGLGNVDAGGYVRLWDACRRGDWAAATTEQDRLAVLFDIILAAAGRSTDARGVGAFKTAMVHLGLLPSARMAPPIRPLNDEQTQAVLDIVRAWQATPTPARSTVGP